MPSWVLFTIYIPAETEKQPKVTSKSLQYDDRTNYAAEQKHFADSKLQNNVIFLFLCANNMPYEKLQGLVNSNLPHIKTALKRL